MERINQVKITGMTLEDLARKKNVTLEKQPGAWRKPEPQPKCAKCGDVGFYVPDVDVTHSDFGRALPCPCRFGVNREKYMQRLMRIDGLTEHERAMRFEFLDKRKIAHALGRVQQATQDRRGLITLTGKPGLGKSALLICAVNEVREAGVPAVYTTVTDLFDYLKAAFDPKTHDGMSFDSRWDLLIKAEVLALDELDEFNTTPWAMERFLRLIDERWRRMDDRLTLLTTNSRINALPDKVASRLRDGRGEVIEMQGADMRPYQVWEAS